MYNLNSASSIVAEKAEKIERKKNPIIR